MKRIVLLLAVVLIGCVDNGCPTGSEEVDGICTEQSSPLTGDSDASTDESNSTEPSDAGHPDTDRPDDSGTREDAGDGGCDGASCDEPEPCEPGFARVGAECADIDECTAGTASCDANATCINEPGSFSCECQPGYEGDGTTCAENPCESRVNPCDAATTICRVDGSLAACDCQDGLARCNDDPYACETDLRSDHTNCGACEAECAGDLACVDAECEQAVTQLALGLDHTCALAADGEVLCWGSNNNDQLARQDATRPLYEPSPTRFGAARLLTATSQETCILSPSNDLTCWGNNLFRRIDPSQPEGGVTATIAMGLANIEQISVGLVHTCMIVADLVECWGPNDRFVVGSPLAEVIPFADRAVVDVPDSSLLATGRDSCALGDDSLLRCWGGETPAIYLIVDSTGEPLPDVRSVSLSNGWTLGCAAAADGRALCWGENGAGQLGNPAATEARSERAVVVNDDAGQALSGVEQVAVGHDHACARTQDGVVLCWGRSDRVGSAGSGTGAQRHATAVRGIDDAVDIAAGAFHTCARRRSGQLQCWGDNGSGQVGVSNIAGDGVAAAFEPVDVLGLP